MRAHMLYEFSVIVFAHAPVSVGYQLGIDHVHAGLQLSDILAVCLKVEIVVYYSLET